MFFPLLYDAVGVSIRCTCFMIFFYGIQVVLCPLYCLPYSIFCSFCFLLSLSILPTTSSFLCPHSTCLCRSGWEAASAKGEAAARGGRKSQGRAGKEADTAAGWGSHGQRGTGKIHFTRNPPFCCQIYVNLSSSHTIFTSPPPSVFSFSRDLLILPL